MKQKKNIQLVIKIEFTKKMKNKKMTWYLKILLNKQP